MPGLSIRLVKPKMLLASEVRSFDSSVVIPKGQELTEQHIRIMKIWGVTEVEVEEAPQAGKSECQEPDDEALRQRFRDVDMSSPAISELYRVCQGRCEQTQESEPGEVENTCLAAPHRENLKNSLQPEDLLREEARLPSLPDVFYRVNEVVNDPRSSAAQVAGVISKDPSLSARLLRLVNSPFYGFPQSVDTITRAAMVAGGKQLSLLAMAASIMQAFHEIPSELVNMRTFWKHCLACGLAARSLGAAAGLPNTERLFVAGLLHDLGRLLMFERLPGLCCQAILLSLEKSQPMLKSEREVLGFDHARIGGLLLKKWKIPAMIEHSVKDHHSPMSSLFTEEAAAVHWADVIVCAMGLGAGLTNPVPQASDEALGILGLGPGVFEPTLAQVDHLLGQTMLIFFPESRSGNGK